MERNDDPTDPQPGELDPELQRGLRALRVDVPPPPGAESAVLETLRQRGVLPRATRRPGLGAWLGRLPSPAAAGVVLLLAAGTFGAGFAAGRSATGRMPAGSGAQVGTQPPAGARAPAPADAPAGAPAATGPLFLLLLYEDAGFQRAPVGLQAQRAHEYGAWARGLAPTARFVDGEELAEAGRLLEPGGTARPWRSGDALPAPGAVGGYFVVQAADLDAAEALARGCPHLAHGGRIEVRPVVHRDATP
jgi:hypothetical protein